MAKVVNKAWKNDMESLIFQHQPIDVTISFRPALQWLVIKLSNIGVGFKLHNLGAGVTRITTDTTICPCCKKLL